MVPLIDHADRGRKRHHALVDDLRLLLAGLRRRAGRWRETPTWFRRRIRGWHRTSECGATSTAVYPVSSSSSRLAAWSSFSPGSMRPAGSSHKIVGGGVAVLAFQQDARRCRGIVHGQHDDGAGVVDDVAPRASRRRAPRRGRWSPRKPGRDRRSARRGCVLCCGRVLGGFGMRTI